MNIDEINLGDPPTGAGGDTIRDAFGKTNQNFGAAKQALEDEVQAREQLLSTQRDQLIALIESVNGPLPNLRADFKARSFGVKNESGVFLPCAYEDLFTLSAPSPKWVWNAQGQLIQVPAGQPAWDHDPVTGQPLGQRLEPEDTNGHTNGQLDIAVSDYTITDANDPYLPDAKILTADVQHTTAGHTSLNDVYPFGSGGGSNQGLRVIYVKEGMSRYVGLRTSSGPDGFTFDLLNGEVLQDSVQGEITTHTRKLAGGWWELAFLRPWGPAVRNQYFVGFGSSVSGLTITAEIGDQITLAYPSMYDTNNSTPPSIIKTNGSAVTRSADVVTIQNVDTAEWFDADAFTIFMEFQPGEPISSPSYKSVLETQDARFRMTFRSNSFQPIFRGFAGDAIPVSSANIKAAVSAVNGVSFLYAANGVSAGIERDALAAFDALSLCESLPANLINLQIEKRDLTAAELQDLTQ